MNAESRAVISAKHAAQGTDSFAEASADCTAVLQRIRDKLFPSAQRVYAAFAPELKEMTDSE